MTKLKTQGGTDKAQLLSVLYQLFHLNYQGENPLLEHLKLGSPYNQLVYNIRMQLLLNLLASMLKNLFENLEPVSSDSLRLYSIPETAEILGVDKRTVNYLIEEGRLGFIHVKKRRMVPAKEIESFVQENTIRMSRSPMDKNAFDQIFRFQSGEEIINELLITNSEGDNE